MILRIATIVAALCGVLLMIRPPQEPFDIPTGVLLGTTICFLVVAIILEIVSYCRTKPLLLADDGQIRDYMYKWISRGGKVVIFSNDMSWVRDDEMKELLRSKASRDELCICLPNTTSLADQLECEGAEVCVYPELRYVPESRFTIINKGRMDARVAVGRRIKSKHMIEEFSAGDHPFYWVANDLTEIVRQFSHWKKAGQGKDR